MFFDNFLIVDDGPAEVKKKHHRQSERNNIFRGWDSFIESQPNPLVSIQQF